MPEDGEKLNRQFEEIIVIIIAYEFLWLKDCP